MSEVLRKYNLVNLAQHAWKLIRKLAKNARSAWGQLGRAMRSDLNFRWTYKLALENWGTELWVQLSYPLDVDPLTLNAPNKSNQLKEMARCLQGPAKMREHFLKIEKADPSWTREHTVRREQANLKLLALDPSNFELAVTLDPSGK